MTAAREYYSRPKTWDSLRMEGDGVMPVVFIAGGTDLVPLMDSGIERPGALIDLSDLLTGRIEEGPRDSVFIGAMARLSDVAAHPLVREHLPVVAEALLAGGSPQVRNLATVGGNLLQRTRCGYFRDRASPCNKRLPGSGCPAQEIDNRRHAIFGGSERCVAVHASDLAVALSALDARIAIRTGSGARRVIALDELYRLPGRTPELETTLEAGEVITEVEVPISGLAQRSSYQKIRDRASFDFALVSAAVALDLDSGRVREARVALGGVAPRPWRLREIEADLVGRAPLAAEVRDALAGFERAARPLRDNGFKVELARELIVRALSDLGDRA